MQSHQKDNDDWGGGLRPLPSMVSMVQLSLVLKASYKAV